MIRPRWLCSFLWFGWGFRFLSSSWKWHLRNNTGSSPVEISWDYIIILRPWYLNVLNLSWSCANGSHSCCKMHFNACFISNLFFLNCIIVLRSRSRISVKSQILLFVTKSSRWGISLSWCAPSFCHFPMLIVLVWSGHKLIYFCKLSSLVSNCNPWISSKILYMIGIILSWSCHFLNSSFRRWVFQIQKSYWVTNSRIDLSTKLWNCRIFCWTWTNILSNICKKHAVNSSLSLNNIFWSIWKSWFKHIMTWSWCYWWLLCIRSLNRCSWCYCLGLTHCISFWNQFSVGPSYSNW